MRDLPRAARARGAVRASLDSKRRDVFPAAIWRQHEPECSFSRRGARRRVHCDQGSCSRRFLATANTGPHGCRNAHGQRRNAGRVMATSPRFSRLTIQAIHRPNSPLARRSKPAWRARSASVSCPPCRAGGAPATVTMPCLRRPGPSGAVATLEVSTCTRASSSQPAIATAANGSFASCARPPHSLERLSVLDDGRIAYAIRKPWGNETHRVMSPLQLRRLEVCRGAVLGGC